LRIAPMFWLAIPFFLLLTGKGAPAWEVATTALFVHGFHPQTVNSVVPGGWVFR